MSDPLHVIRLMPEDSGLTPLELNAEDFQSPLPEQHAHIYYEDADIGLVVGVWDTTTMQEAFGPYPGDEFICVIDGNFAMIDGKGDATPAHKGDCVAFRNGAPMSWKQDGYLKKFFVTYLNPNAPTPNIPNADGAVIVLDPGAPLTDISEPGGPKTGQHVAFQNDEGNMVAGLWTSEAASGAMTPHPVHEFAIVLEGDAVLTEANGRALILLPGDCYFIPRGTECGLDIPTSLKLHFARIDAG